MTQTITLRRPDDWHLHLRDGAMLRAVLPETTRHFARAIIMPNLVPPVVTGDHAAAYRERILAALPEGAVFEPLMTLYLTETTRKLGFDFIHHFHCFNNTNDISYFYFVTNLNKGRFIWSRLSVKGSNNWRANGVSREAGWSIFNRD